MGTKVTTNLDEVFPKLYPQLRKAAHSELGELRILGHLRPTELLHDAYLKLAAIEGMEWTNEKRVKALFATTIWNLAIDRMRKHARFADRRSHIASLSEATNSESNLVSENDQLSKDIEEALDTLSDQYPDLGRILVQRVLDGKSIGEIAAESGKSSRTVYRKYQFARSWMLSQLRVAESEGKMAKNRHRSS